MDTSAKTEREIRRCAGVGAALGVFPLLELLLIVGRIRGPSSFEQIAWAACCVVGLLYSFRSFRLATRATTWEYVGLFLADGHILALLFLGVGRIWAADPTK